MRYALTQPGSLGSPLWEGSGVVFDRRTGDTHLVSAPSQVVLAILRDSPFGATDAELGRRLSGMVSPEDEEHVLEAVREALIELQRIRLVEQLEGD